MGSRERSWREKQGSPPPVARAHTNRTGWWAVAGLVLLVALAYGQTHAFDLVRDDFAFVSSPVLRGRVGWWTVLTSPTSVLLQMPGADRMYRPLLALSMAADRVVWGMRPGGFHLSSVLTHLAVVLLLWQLAWRLTGSRGAAFAAGALLAVHPSAVEAVVFIVGARMDLFAGLGIAAVLLLLRKCLAPGGGFRLLSALVCFALALGSKETAVAIPVIVTWAAWVHPEWLAGPGSPPSRAALAARVVPFWVMLGVYGVLRRAVVGSLAPITVDLADIPAQVPRALVAVATYGEMTLIPQPTGKFILLGAVAPPTGLADGRVFAGMVVIALLLGGLLWLRRRCAAAAFALGWYAAALVPTSNLLPIYTEQALYVAERSLYPALIGWCLFLAVAGHAVRGAASGLLGRSRTLVRAMGSAVVGTFLVVTIVKAGAWRDNVTIWSAAVVAHPGSATIRTNLIGALANAGDLQAAREAARVAAVQFPADPMVSFMDGWVAELRGDHAQALRGYERAIALGAREGPLLRQAAFLAARIGEWDMAGRWFAAAADLYGQAAWPQVGLGWYHQRMGRDDLARVHFERAAQLEPRSPERPWFQGQLLAMDGHTGEAAREYQAALALDASFVPARRELALLAEREGRIAEAMDQWRRIAASLPGPHGTEAREHLRRLDAARGAPSPAGGR